MARGYSRDDVEQHSDGYGRTQHPAVNVKSYHFPGVDQVVERFGCSEDTAERALGFAFEAQAEQFWEAAIQLAGEVFGEAFGYASMTDRAKPRRVWQEGRSGGWLVVHGLPAGDVEDWDAIDLAHWRSFERQIKEAVKWAESWENVADLIDMNEWAHDQAAMERVLAAAHA